jgi:hypothetical protein
MRCAEILRNTDFVCSDAFENKNNIRVLQLHSSSVPEKSKSGDFIATCRSHAFATANRVYPISFTKPQSVQSYYLGKLVTPLSEESTQLDFVSELTIVKQFRVTQD